MYIQYAIMNTCIYQLKQDMIQFLLQTFIPSFENNVDLDQLVLVKQGDQDTHCFHPRNTSIFIISKHIFIIILNICRIIYIYIYIRISFFRVSMPQKFESWPQGYNTLFMLNSTDHRI